MRWVEPALSKLYQCNVLRAKLLSYPAASFRHIWFVGDFSHRLSVMKSFLVNLDLSFSPKSPEGRYSSSALLFESLWQFECTPTRICGGRFQIVWVAFSTVWEAYYLGALDAISVGLSGFNRLWHQWPSKRTDPWALRPLRFLILLVSSWVGFERGLWAHGNGLAVLRRARSTPCLPLSRPFHYCCERRAWYS